MTEFGATNYVTLESTAFQSEKQDGRSHIELRAQGCRSTSRGDVSHRGLETWKLRLMRIIECIIGLE